HYRSISNNTINNSDLCYKNVVRFKKLLDTLHYKDPVVTMTDCTKVKSGLQFFSSLGCIVGSTLNQNDCIIKTYDDIYDKVSLSKFSPVIVVLISNINDNGKKIFALYQKLIEIATNLELYIISIRLDSTITEFQAQNLLQATKTKYRVQYQNLQFAKNTTMSDAHLLTFENSIVYFDHLLELSLKEDSVMYKQDIKKLDYQDDNIAYRVFCSNNLAQVLDNEEALLSELQ
ncbi:32367_t:CDS:2, partial [Racocetra persica]